MGSQEYYTGLVSRQNNNNPNFQYCEFADSGFFKYLPICIISAYVESTRAASFLYFELNSKVIVTNMSTQVTYETNHNSILLDSMMESELYFLFFLHFNVRKHERKLLSQNCNIWVMERSCLKQNKMIFSKKTHFLKNVSRLKARYKKTMRCTHCIVQVGIRLCKKRKRKEKCAILRLMLNILSFLIVVTSLFHKWRSLLNSSKILLKND